MALPFPPFMAFPMCLHIQSYSTSGKLAGWRPQIRTPLESSADLHDFLSDGHIHAIPE